MICPAANLSYAQQLAAAAVGPSAVGMWPSGLSLTGVAPATHYVEEGMIQSQFASLLPFSTVTINALGATVVTALQAGDAATVARMANTNGMTPATTAAAVQSLFTAISVTDESPFPAMARLGLKMIVGAV